LGGQTVLINRLIQDQQFTFQIILKPGCAHPIAKLFKNIHSFLKNPTLGSKDLKYGDLMKLIENIYI
jgi:hypothetical protein